MTPLQELCLTDDEYHAISRLLSHITGGQMGIQLDDLLDEAQLYAHELPLRVRRLFYEFKLREGVPGVIVHGPALPAANYGETPAAITKKERELLRFGDILHVLFSSLLGEPFTWNSIQHGNLINEIVPIVEHADTPRSSGSKFEFSFHNEDAFHEYMGDYLGLFCVRNPTETPTSFSYLGDCNISAADARVLFQPKFRIRANIAHAVSDRVTPQSIFFGSRDAPYFRVNTNYSPDCDSEATAAYNRLLSELHRNCQEVTLHQNDFLYLDNFRTVHGRPAYSPRYDGNDRWLKRIYISAYLRKSRAARASAHDRLIRVGE